MKATHKTKHDTITTKLKIDFWVNLDTMAAAVALNCNSNDPLPTTKKAIEKAVRKELHGYGMERIFNGYETLKGIIDVTDKYNADDYEFDPPNPDEYLEEIKKHIATVFPDFA